MYSSPIQYLMKSMYSTSICVKTFMAHHLRFLSQQRTVANCYCMTTHSDLKQIQVSMQICLLKNERMHAWNERVIGMKLPYITLTTAELSLQSIIAIMYVGKIEKFNRYFSNGISTCWPFPVLLKLY